jgi:leader peptidase (prepilin peptidase)/N-methyltransferase
MGVQSVQGNKRKVRMTDMQFDWVKTVVILTGLLINSVCDLRRKQISLITTAIMAIMGIALHIAERLVTWEWAFALIPGMIFLVLAWATKQKIGYGDGFIFLSLGCLLEWESMLSVCVTAGIFAGIAALVLLVFFHKKGSYEIPFVPFIFIGYCVWRWLV